MNESQMNLYEILDAFGLEVKAGKDTFEIQNQLRIENKEICVTVDIEGLYLHELATSMWAIMRVGDLGIVAKAKNAALAQICFFDMSHPIPEFYASTEDWAALLTHMSKDKWKNEFIARNVKC